MANASVRKSNDSRARRGWKALQAQITSFKIFDLKWADLRMAAVFLGLILLPSGLLAYLSWRAIESEKLAARERLEESYREFAHLAARKIDDELEKVEKQWVEIVKAGFDQDASKISAESVQQLSAQEPLFAGAFFFSAPGQVVYPPDVNWRENNAPAFRWEKESYVREHEIFNKLLAQGEELEYRENNLAGAIATYREIIAQVTSPRLRGMAASCIGRALMKQGQWPAALAAFEKMLALYPEARDLYGMHLRFVAQYQIAVCLENLERDEEAVAALLRLYQDLLERSDEITTVQYSTFLEQIRNLAPRLLSSPKLANPEPYKAQFRALAEQSKKRLSQKYFLQILDRRLNKMVIERKHYNAKLRYLSEETDNDPYLLAYWPVRDPSGTYITSLLGLQIDLAQLRQHLFPATLRYLKRSENVTLAILNEKGDYVIGTARPANAPIAVEIMAEPFDFWQVAVYLREAQTPSSRLDFRQTMGVWLISLLLLSIVSGAYIFIRRARREARLSQMKSTFVSNVSHELRTPLASIKMMAELLEMQLANRAANAETIKKRAEQNLSIIRRECGRLGRLIENVLDFSRLERGAKQYNFEYEDTTAVLDMAIASFRPHAEAQGFILEANIADDLPELRLDADAVTQVMLNLLSNAVKYSAEHKEIRVRAYCEKTQIVIEIADRGVGITARELPKIFNEFYRSDQRLNTPQ